MGLPILIIGRSGSGKSTSIRNMKHVVVFNVNNKPLPFPNTENISGCPVDNFIDLKTYLLGLEKKGFKTAVIDDAGYLMTKAFMAGHRSAKGNNQFDLYNDIADGFYFMIQTIINELPKDVIVYITMHEDQNDFGNIQPKTIGKLLNDKVNIEGLFTIVLRCLKVEGKHVFATRTDGFDVTKTPIGMFNDLYIDNDLQLVDDTVRAYYKMEEKK